MDVQPFPGIRFMFFCDKGMDVAFASFPEAMHLPFPFEVQLLIMQIWKKLKSSAKCLE